MRAEIAIYVTTIWREPTNEEAHC